MGDVFIKLPDGVVINISCIESFGVDYVRVENTEKVNYREVLKIRTKSGNVLIVENVDFINIILKEIYVPNWEKCEVNQ